MCTCTHTYVYDHHVRGDASGPAGEARCASHISHSGSPSAADRVNGNSSDIQWMKFHSSKQEEAQECGYSTLRTSKQRSNFMVGDTPPHFHSFRVIMAGGKCHILSEVRIKSYLENTDNGGSQGRIAHGAQEHAPIEKHAKEAECDK